MQFITPKFDCKKQKYPYIVTFSTYFQPTVPNSLYFTHEVFAVLAGQLQICSLPILKNLLGCSSLLLNLIARNKSTHTLSHFRPIFSPQCQIPYISHMRFLQCWPDSFKSARCRSLKICSDAVHYS